MKVWRCILCGYVHHGDQPPEICPICGAPASDFEEVDEHPAAAPAAPALTWRCIVCGYVHSGTEPPEECPLCAAPRSSFETVAAEPVSSTPSAQRGQRIVIVGAGIAGVSAAEAARRTDATADIVLLSQENESPYYRINLTRFLAGDVREADLLLRPESWYAQQAIELLKGAEVLAVHPASCELDLAGGQKLSFDQLILTSGAHAFVPPLPGADLAGVFSLRRLHDARALLASFQPGRRCICLGGGLLGLETAGALAKRGAAVTVLESHSSLMPRQLNARAGEILGRYVEGIGIRLVTRAKTREVLGEGHVQQVVLEDGVRLEADMVILATGVRSNTFLARAAGLDCRQGILVDQHMRTSQTDVFAAGDAAEHQGVLYGSWHAAQIQGDLAGMNAAGAGRAFGMLPRSHTLKVLGLPMTSIGQIEPADGGDRVVEEENGEVYQRFIFRDGRLVGAVLLGTTGLAAAANHAIERQQDFSELLTRQPTVGSVVQHLNVPA